MHKSQEELVNERTIAAQNIQVGGLYYHYKNPNDLYKVLNLAVTEWDDEVCVIYEAQYGERITFVRPLSSWLEKVEWNGKIVDRFTLNG
jgi:hypothetical protein